MAADFDYTQLNHLIGNNKFDADMDIVESFVKHHHEPENEIVQNAVQNYYLSRLYHYWDVTKDYATSEEFVKDNQNTNSKNVVPLTLDRIKIYEEEFNRLIRIIKENFNQTSKVNLKIITYTFEFIATMACAFPTFNPEFIEKYKTFHTIYPLPNTIGIFGFNTYLYAYFEDVFLVGVPTRVAYYDRGRTCPLYFISHDYGHTYDLKRADSDSKNIYYTILNDTALSPKFREMYIVIMWLLIHEFGIKITLDFPLPQLASVMVASFGKLYSEIGDELHELFISFLPLLSDEKEELISTANELISTNSSWKSIKSNMEADFTIITPMHKMKEYIHAFYLMMWSYYSYIHSK